MSDDLVRWLLDEPPEPESGDCPRCEGTGTMTVYDAHWRAGGTPSRRRCTQCKGTGRLS